MCKVFVKAIRLIYKGEKKGGNSWPSVNDEEAVP